MPYLWTTSYSSIASVSMIDFFFGTKTVGGLSLLRCFLEVGFSHFRHSHKLEGALT